jgi:hypothetical protein
MDELFFTTTVSPSSAAIKASTWPGVAAVEAFMVVKSSVEAAPSVFTKWNESVTVITPLAIVRFDPFDRTVFWEAVPLLALVFMSDKVSCDLIAIIF